MKKLLIANLERILDILKHQDYDIYGSAYYDKETGKHYNSTHNLKAELKSKMREFRRDSIAYDKMLKDSNCQHIASQQFRSHNKVK